MPAATELAAYASFAFPAAVSTWFPRPNGALWSLGIEVWFSALFPLVVVGIERLGIVSIFGLAFFVSTAMRTAAALVLPLAYFNVNRTLDFFGDSVVGRLDNFILGMVVAHLVTVGPPVRAVERRRALVLGGVALWFFSGLLWEQWRVGRDEGDPLFTVIGNELSNWGFAFILFGAVVSAPADAVARVLGFAPLRWVGVRCYSIYLFHVPLMDLVRPKTLEPWRVVLFLALVCATAFVGYALLEKPFIDYAHRRLKGGHPA